MLEVDVKARPCGANFEIRCLALLELDHPHISEVLPIGNGFYVSRDMSVSERLVLVRRQSRTR